MRTTVYLHPLRTVVASWNDDAIPVLTAYHERGANEVISDLIVDPAQTTVAIHGGAIVVHTYPLDPDENADDRRLFEQTTCLPDLEDADLVRTLVMDGIVHGSGWSGLLVVPSAYVAAAHRRCGDGVNIVSDLEADINCARAVMHTTSEPWLLIGRRGGTWQRVIVDANGTVVHISVVPVETSTDPGTHVAESLLAARAGIGDRIRRVVLFGDQLTKATFNAVTTSLRDIDAGAIRLQPFRSVRSGVAADLAAAIVAKAHLIGPLVGPVLPANAVESPVHADHRR